MREQQLFQSAAGQLGKAGHLSAADQLTAAHAPADQTASTRPLTDFYCARCMALAFAEDPRCVYCRHARPARGWEPVANSGDPWLGRILAGRYLVTRRIGQGATARVYEAESLNISRRFALKIIDTALAAQFYADLADQAAPAGQPGEDSPPGGINQARVQREFAALCQVNSPHIIELFEVLSLSSRCQAAVLEFAPGQTLRRLLSRQLSIHQKPFPWPRVLRLLRQLAAACCEVHAQGMVHRDLKPANIMVEQLANGDDFLRLLDFGIVQADDGARITRGFVGTPLYASPEQASGRLVGPASDIYAFGVICFELLVGRPPFESPDIMEVLRMQVRARPPTLNEALPEAKFPAELQDFVRRLLRKSPQQRPASFQAVSTEIDRLLTLAPNSTPTQPTSQTSKKSPLQLPKSPAKLPAPHAIIAPTPTSRTLLHHGPHLLLNSLPVPSQIEPPKTLFKAPNASYISSPAHLFLPGGISPAQNGFLHDGDLS